MKATLTRYKSVEPVKESFSFQKINEIPGIYVRVGDTAEDVYFVTVPRNEYERTGQKCAVLYINKRKNCVETATQSAWEHERFEKSNTELTIHFNP